MDPRISVQPARPALLTLALALAACGKPSAQQDASAPVITNAAAAAERQRPASRQWRSGSPSSASSTSATACVQNVALHPGQSVRWKDVVVRLRACETTAPWEQEKLTGAFVQVDVQQPDRKLEPRILRLAVQGVAVAQRRRAPGL